MNRREFLMSLAACHGFILTDPKAIASALEVQIDDIWLAALSAPSTFFVESGGVLTTMRIADIPPHPSSRRELYGRDTGRTAESFLKLANEDWRIEDLLSEAYEEAMVDDDADKAGENWRDWLRNADGDTLEVVRKSVGLWLDGMDESDYEYVGQFRFSGQQQALQFFIEQRTTADLFSIVSVGADSPAGTDYAELRMPLTEANALAKRDGIPIQFASGD